MFHRHDEREIHSVAFGSGPTTLVGVAGSFADWEIWGPTFELLSRDWRVVGFDHDGVGHTRVPVGEIAPERHLETLLSVLDHHEIERCVIAGDSNNATLAIRAAVEHPDRFDGLIVVNGHAWGFDYPAALAFPDRLRTDFEATVSFFVDLVFPEEGSDQLKDQLAAIIRRTGPEAAAHIVEMYFGMDLRPEIDRLDLPALVVHGALDDIGPAVLDAARELADRLGADLELVPDAGHLPLLSRPHAVARAIDSFLSDLVAAGSSSLGESD